MVWTKPDLLVEVVLKKMARVRWPPAPAANSKSLNWKSNGIELFISESMTEAKELTEILQTLKGTMKRVEETVDIWSSQPIFDRAMKPVLMDDIFYCRRKHARCTLLQ